MRLRDLREDRDLTQKQVADFLSIKQNTYSQYENGVRQLPIDLLIRLSRYYTVSTVTSFRADKRAGAVPSESKKALIFA